MQDAVGMQAASRDPGGMGPHGPAPDRRVHCVTTAETQAASCLLSKDTPPQLLTGRGLTMRYRGRVVGAEESRS
ncbi:hypothetical protein EYF80_029130 [Liparis tanakae]|uniref:Uncharacterized protein n=1 Tax=Liparis tanakae TaxID=230148 RepID=A0A4Z2H464_9TELE|nr:hypothetical protein EYF80_029130 [Liparis tanakae]